MDRIQPETVFDPQAYAQAIRVDRTLYVSGQVALARDGSVVGPGDLAAQATFIWEQIGAILEEAGGRYSDIVKVTTYVLDMAARGEVMAARARYLGDHRAASTLIGVAALARPEFLIEIEVVAVLPERPWRSPGSDSSRSEC